MSAGARRTAVGSRVAACCIIHGCLDSPSSLPTWADLHAYMSMRSRSSCTFKSCTFKSCTLKSWTRVREQQHQQETSSRAAVSLCTYKPQAVPGPLPHEPPSLSSSPSRPCDQSSKSLSSRIKCWWVASAWCQFAFVEGTTGMRSSKPAFASTRDAMPCCLCDCAKIAMRVCGRRSTSSAASGCARCARGSERNCWTRQSKDTSSGSNSKRSASVYVLLSAQTLRYVGGGASGSPPAYPTQESMMPVRSDHRCCGSWNQPSPKTANSVGVGVVAAI